MTSSSRSPQRVRWPLQAGQEVETDLLGTLEGNAAPVLFLRGMDLAADWSFYPYLLEKLAEHRPVLVPVVPAGATLSAELAVVEALVAALAKARPGKVGLLGHAKGAALALLVAERHASVGGVVGISTICTFNRGGEQALPGRSDVAQHGERFQVELAARGTRCPVVLVHGEEDAIAPFAEGELVYHWLPKEHTSLVLLEKTGHSLGATNPFAGTNKELDRAVRITREFFARVL